MYADNMHITYADKDLNIIQSCLNEDLLNISKWLITNKLTLNMTKTEFMLIGSRQKLNALTASPVLSINGTINVKISRCTHWCKAYLGQSCRSWLNKIVYGIAAIKWVTQFVPPATLHLIYKALIQPHFDYCSVVWGSCGIKLADKLKKLQNCAARALTFSSYDADASQLFQNLNWKNLSTQHDIQKAVTVFKFLNGLAPEYLSSKFIARSKTTSSFFRDSVNKLTIQQPRTNYLHNSFR